MKSILIFLSLIHIISHSIAQVGINTKNPTQTLEVNGQLKIGHDSLATDEEGTIRYNNGIKDLEGFAAGKWQSLTQANLGNNVQVVHLYGPFVATSNSWQKITFNQGYDENIGSSTGTALPVPQGKILVVDQVCVSSNTLNSTSQFRVGVSVRNKTTAATTSPELFITGTAHGGESCIQANKAPVLIGQVDDTIYVLNSMLSNTTVRVIVNAFLVDSLQDYYRL